MTDSDADRRLAVELTIFRAAIDAMSKDWFLIGAGGKTRVCRKEQERLVFYAIGDFKALYQNRALQVGEELRLVANSWLSQAERPTFHGLTMREPAGQSVGSEYNLYEGLGVQPLQGDWTRMRDFLRDVITSRRDREMDYLLDLLAVWFQHPLDVGRIAVQLRGDKGTGKSTFGRILAHLFGNHSLHLSSTRQISGNFNAHLLNAIYVFADEAVWSGDKAGLGNLKRLITEPTLFIEQKGVDPFEMPNRTKLVIASNDHIPMSATRDERRVFALSLNNERQRDFVYFETLMEAMRQGGYGAFLYHLVHERKPSRADIMYNPPDTDELDELKGLSEDDWIIHLRDHGFRDLEAIDGEYRIDDTSVWLSLGQDPAVMLRDRIQGERKNRAMKLLGWSRKLRTVNRRQKWFWITRHAESQTPLPLPEF